ncbi:glycosyltransferase [Nocardioides sp. GXQ0305]|uniref:glycosyltransferase n=1 Tax=Nocardioides sp. GXQ0305 TaxID=3423912 RepID=UPI003D7E5F12
MSAVSRVLVVVPAHDEEAVLGQCLQQVATAAGAVRPAATVRTVVVLDHCSDRSASVAARHDVEVVECHARNVGRARALGVAAAARDVLDDAATWVATTDADSRVGPSWLLDHLAAAAAGYDALLGRVHPDPADLLPAVLREWHRRHPRIGHHVHGANLGVRLAAYRAVGGFRALASGEDVALVRALRDAGAPVASGGTPVVSSGRSRARAPDGFAAYLRALAHEVAPAESPDADSVALRPVGYPRPVARPVTVDDGRP